ncbi:MAG: hypothetical protein PUD63_06140, partial [Clostridia bacterium]|nr:hypothetical protein [Clostridia bacterium]
MKINCKIKQKHLRKQRSEDAFESVSKKLASRSFPTETGGNVFGKAENSPPARQSRAIRTKVRRAAAPLTTPEKFSTVWQKHLRKQRSEDAFEQDYFFLPVS